MSNRLSHETSPYLLQHAQNPVDWYPWGDAAFAKARSEDKPIFLSVGYSTCHWCHVMAHECFEDAQVAAFLNEHFICIKVDKEERPDVDSLYMAASIAFTGSGGWPNSVFTDPQGHPFFAGTYFPKEAFLQLLQNIHDLWLTDRAALLAPVEQVRQQITPRDARPIPADRDLIERAIAAFVHRYDSEYGGFGRAPKFPTAHNLLFLLHAYERYQNRICLQMAEKTLTQMVRGGLFDPIEGGFCRYSTDRQFLVPHFEKMLYDNALLIMAYAKAYALTDKPLYRRAAERTAAWVLQDMTAPHGGFYSALDADSEGQEGRFYLFEKAEIDRVLGEKSEAFCRQFGITDKGNFEGKNIPNRLGSDPDDTTMDDCLPILADYRRTRCSLHRDDKILTYWNGLMIAAFCHLYRITQDDTYLSAARSAEQFVREQMSEGDRLAVSYREGRRGVGGFLEDYAGFAFGQLALYDATLEDAYLDRARRLCEYVLREFADEQGFFLSGRDSERLFVRQKETYDGALPSGNSLMAYLLVRLRQLTDDYEQATERQLQFMAAQAQDHPMNHSVFLLALLEDLRPSPFVTVVSDGTQAPAVLARRLPVPVHGRLCRPDDRYPLKDGKTTYYICHQGRCLPPSHDLSGIS